MERRDSPRTRAHLDVLLCAEGEEAAGALVDISHSGARIEECALQPPVGATARLYVFLPGLPAIELEGTVRRHLESGIALGYALHDAGRSRMVDAVVEHLSLARAS